ncbi:MAG: hypothetical protein J6P65_00950 [Bacteroidales bacterium]|nr:hypothetical protein [Bacteroidales bacterium]
MACLRHAMLDDMLPTPHLRAGLIRWCAVGTRIDTRVIRLPRCDSLTWCGCGDVCGEDTGACGCGRMRSVLTDSMGVVMRLPRCDSALHGAGADACCPIRHGIEDATFL